MRNDKHTKKAPRRRCTPSRAATEDRELSARSASDRGITMLMAGEQVVMAALELAETAVVHVPEEREQVRRVRALVEAVRAGAKPPKVDPRDVAFTIGIVADLTNSDFEQPGIASMLLELLPLPSVGTRRVSEVRERRTSQRAQPRTTPAICRLCLDEYQF